MNSLIPKTSSPSVAFYTLGCKLNFAETSSIASILKRNGIEKCEPGSCPDLCIVNTCSVTETADKKARSLIRRLHKQYPEAAIIATGCYAQLKPRALAELPGVAIVLGSDEKLDMAYYLEQWLHTHQQKVEVTPHLDITDFKPSCERGDRTRFFLKVQDGCDYYCTYCTIPMARGRSRSGSIPLLVNMAKEAANKGGKEIVITGVNTGDFGRGTPYNLLDLLKELDKIEGIERYRISSIEPNLLSDEILEWIASESKTVMPHFHIPLQSGNDDVLRLMGRRYTTDFFYNKLNRVRELIPDAFIGVDIMAGARGETEDRWLKSREFIESLPATRFHVFPYSERPSTKALQLENAVEPSERHKRAAILTEISDSKHYDFLRQMIGSQRKVLWEARATKNMMHGLTDNYIRVEAPYNPELINTITDVNLETFSETSPEILTATIIS